MRRADLLISAILVGLCALAAWKHLDHDGSAPTVVPPVGVGEPLDGHITLADVSGEDRVLADMFGKTATVLYSWKVDCPCIDDCEARMREAFSKFGRDRGVAWIAVDGEPEDLVGDVRIKMGRLQTFVQMLLDPTQRLSARVGFDRAAQVAVLDATGRVRYRGSIDDDYEKPKRSYLEEALAAVLAGTEVPLPETAPVYGCRYSEAPVCVE
jgi:hypothetical protein